MKILNSFFAILLFLSFTRDGDSSAKFISDFCECSSSQTRVYLCSYKDNLRFARSLYKTNLLMSVIFMNRMNGHFWGPKYSNVINHVVDVDCSEALNLLEMANEENLFRPPNKWVLLTRNKSMENDARTAFGHLNFYLDTDVTIARRMEEHENTTFFLSEAYKISYNESLIIKSVGLWNTSDKCQAINYPTSLRRKDLNGLVIPGVIVVTSNETLSLLNCLRDQHIDTVSKHGYNLVTHAMDFMNASARYIEEDTWGYKINGTFNGMVGKLLQGKAEVAATPMFITAERLPLLEYVSMTTPTSTSVWASCYGFLAITAITLFFVVKYENFLEKHEFGRRRKKRPYKYMRASWSDAILLTFGASCQQGFFSEAQGAAGRLVTIVLYGSVILLHTSYSANIVALLQSSGPVIQSIADLLYSPMKVGVHDIAYNRYFFQKIAPAGKKSAFYGMEEGIERVRSGLFAFYVELGSGYYLIRQTFKEEEICDLDELTFLQPSDAWTAMKKHSPYSKLVKIAFRRIQESGLKSRGYSRWFAKKPECDGRQSTFVQVGYPDIRVALCTFGGGIGIAIALFLLELLTFYKGKKYSASKGPSISQPSRRI